jgi:tetratricopeptide (TPR) repeat protein
MTHPQPPQHHLPALLAGLLALLGLLACQREPESPLLEAPPLVETERATPPPLLVPPRAPRPAPRLAIEDASRPSPAPAPIDPVQDGTLRTGEEELLLRSARNALALGNTAEALELFDSYLLQRPDDASVRIEYAGLLVGQGQLARAKEMYGEALVVRPNDGELRRSLADVLIMSGEYSAATRQLEEVLKADPEALETAAMLCRTYTWIRDFESAEAVFDRYLRKLDPSIETDQLLLAPVLLDMQRPKEALPYLERLHRRFPQELRWATHMVLCYHLTGQRDRADRMVEEMAALEPEVVDLRIRLADQLLALQNYKLAMEVNEQVLEASPEDTMALLMAARIHLEAYDVARARELIEKLQPELSGVHSYELARAKFHQLTGEWVASQSLLEVMLLDNPQDHEVRIRLASLLIEKGDLQRAKAELRKVPLDSPQGARARLEIASALTVQGRAEEAVSLCTALVNERPNDVEATLGLVRAQLEMGAIVQAKYNSQRFIEEHSADAMGIGQMRLLLAKAFFLEGNTFQAVRIYELALQEPTAQSPTAYYGLAAAKRKGVSEASSELALMSSTMRASGEDVRLRIELGKLALGDQEYERASAYFTSVLRWQPDNVAAMVLLGEAQNLALKAGIDADPRRTFSTVLARNPENTRARLGLARALVIERRYEDAIAEYEGIVAQDATYTFAQREYARALYWNHQREEAFEVYDQLLVGLPTDALAIDLFGSTGPGDVAGAELDFEAELELSEAVRLERRAKETMDWQPAAAIEALRDLLVLEPANQEARFDLAQLLHRRGYTRDAIDAYEELIEVSGGHSEAVEAMAGAERAISPRLDLNVGSEKRVGSERLAFIKENWALTDVSFPLGDRDDYFGLGFGRRKYEGGGGAPAGQANTYSADVLRLFGSKAIGKRTTIDGRVEYPSYSTDEPAEVLMKSRPYFDAGIRYLTDEELSVNLRFFTEPVVQNSLTLNQDIHRGGARLGFTKSISQELDYGLSASFASYSDEKGNSELAANGFVVYEFNPAPKEFKVMLKADYQNFSNENDPTVGIDPDIPYFAPQAYSIYTLRADWKHQFGEDNFTGARDMFYEASAAGAIDSESFGYIEFRVGAAYDFTDWLGLRAGTRFLRSDAIDVTTAHALLQLRWP